MPTRMKFPKRKEKRQKEALERNAKYAALTLDQQIQKQEKYMGKQYKKLLVQKEKKK